MYTYIHIYMYIHTLPYLTLPYLTLHYIALHYITVSHCIVVAAEASSAIQSDKWCKLTSLLFHVG